ncbi:MAG: Panacea domain-containing protein [Acidobacteriaceae bacterium]
MAARLPNGSFGICSEEVMGEIQFEFSLDKLIHAIAFFSTKNLPDLTKLKVAKLLYFADKKHLLENGRPILGDVYWCMEFGPVPSFALNEMNEAIAGSEVAAGADSDSSAMSEVLRVRKPFFGGFPYFEAKRTYDRQVFDDSEVNALSFVADTYGRETARRLVDLTHAEPTWQIANQARGTKARAPIPYELFFEGAPSESMKYLARLKAEFTSEAIPLESDIEYSRFASGLRSHTFEAEFDLDSDHERERVQN